MNIITRFKKLSLWNKIGLIGAFASIIGLVLFFIPAESKVKVKSVNQTGGITAGKIDNINITTVNETNLNEEMEQKKKDAQTALIYQTEISHFFYKFKTCLHWTLPSGNLVDKEIDLAFNYGVNFSQGINYENISERTVIKIFTNYNFANKMPNYVGEENFSPTGFNNLIGILEYFDRQLDKYLNKYGGSTSTNLSGHIEYMQRMTQSTISSIRLDLHSDKKINQSTIKNIAELILLMRNDFLLMENNYTNNISGGYPIVAGKVLKSDKTDGSILVETQFSNY